MLQHEPITVANYERLAKQIVTRPPENNQSPGGRPHALPADRSDYLRAVENAGKNREYTIAASYLTPASTQEVTLATQMQGVPVSNVAITAAVRSHAERNVQTAGTLALNAPVVLPFRSGSEGTIAKTDLHHGDPNQSAVAILGHDRFSFPVHQPELTQTVTLPRAVLDSLPVSVPGRSDEHEGMSTVRMGLVHAALAPYRSNAVHLRLAPQASHAIIASLVKNIATSARAVQPEQRNQILRVEIGSHDVVHRKNANQHVNFAEMLNMDIHLLTRDESGRDIVQQGLFNPAAIAHAAVEAGFVDDAALPDATFTEPIQFYGSHDVNKKLAIIYAMGNSRAD